MAERAKYMRGEGDDGAYVSVWESGTESNVSSEGVVSSTEGMSDLKTKRGARSGGGRPKAVSSAIVDPTHRG